MTVSDRSPAEAREDDLRSAISTWLTLAHDSNFPSPVSDLDLLRLRDWVDGGCAGDMPEPEGTPPSGDMNRLHESIRVMWETKEWTRAQFRAALVEARLAAR